MQFTYARKHMKAHKDMITMLPDLVDRLTPSNHPGIQVAEIEFGKVIGASDCVQTDETDTIVFKCRPGRRQPSRMVLNRLPEPTTKISVVYVMNGQTVHVISAWFGGLSPKEPHDQSMTAAEAAESRKFWANHALIG